MEKAFTSSPDVAAASATTTHGSNVDPGDHTVTPPSYDNAEETELSTAFLVLSVLGSVLVTFGLIFGLLVGVRCCVLRRWKRSWIIASILAVFALAAVAFACCLSASLLTDDPEGEFLALMFTIQLGAFLLLPVAVAISYCITNYIRYFVVKHGMPSCCPGCCAQRILADIESIQRQQEYEARRREQQYMSAQDVLDRMTELERGLDAVPNYDEAMERSAPAHDDVVDGGQQQHQTAPSTAPPVYTRSEGEATASMTGEAASGPAAPAVFVPPSYEEALKHEVLAKGPDAPQDTNTLDIEMVGEGGEDGHINGGFQDENEVEELDETGEDEETETESNSTSPKASYTVSSTVASNEDIST